MILIGDKLIPFENMYKINSINDLQDTTVKHTISFGYNEKLMEYVCKNDLQYAVVVSSIKESIYANALNAKYIIAAKELAMKIQQIAENYMFDSKILAIIESNEEIEEVALKEVDGVIYKALL
jgi:hypothetical protein